MLLSKAIEILYDLLGESPQFPPDDRRDAVKLGIEALRREKSCRVGASITQFDLLPSETKE